MTDTHQGVGYANLHSEDNPTCPEDCPHRGPTSLEQPPLPERGEYWVVTTNGWIAHYRWRKFGSVIQTERHVPNRSNPHAWILIDTLRWENQPTLDSIRRSPNEQAFDTFEAARNHARRNLRRKAAELIRQGIHLLERLDLLDQPHPISAHCEVTNL